MMRIKELLAAIKTRATQNISELENRAYILSSRDLSPKTVKYPFVSIVYKGGEPQYGKGIPSGIERCPHRVEINIFQTIWNDYDVIMGLGNKKGLIDYLDELLTIFESYRFESELGNIYDCQIKQIYESETFVEVQGTEMAAGIAILVEYKEQVTT